MSKAILDNLFSQLKIKAKIINYKKENSLLLFDVMLGDGETFKKIERFSTEIALCLKSFSKPTIYPDTKNGLIRIELIHSAIDKVIFKDISHNISESCFDLPLCLGKKPNGEDLVVDLAEMPHILVGGSTGSGKSVLLHTIINSLIINNKKDIKLAILDPKRIEFSNYEESIHLFCPIAKDVSESISILRNLVSEMEDRFVILEKNKCKNISEYDGYMPYIVVIIDELADLMISSKKYVQESICKLAQKSRACGIHLIIATQRPSVDVLTGSIKANFPIRISCKTSSATDSRVILDKNGAEKLLGKGDAVIDGLNFCLERFQVAFISDEEAANNIVNRKRTVWSYIWNT